MPQTTTCPGCHLKSEVDDASIGRFIRCEQCRCLYYVVVPPLGELRNELQSVAATSSVSGSNDTSSSYRRPQTESEVLRSRVQRLTALIVLNLLISLIVLVLVVRPFLS